MTKFLKSYCAKSHCAKQIDYVGYKSDVNKLMANAKALIVASRFEAFGLISVEAMFNGCPVIGHNVAGTKCQFDNGLAYTGTEIGFRYKEQSEIFDKMKDVDSMTEMDCVNLRKKAQDTVCEFYDKGKSANEVMNLYKKITGKSSEERL